MEVREEANETYTLTVTPRQYRLLRNVLQNQANLIRAEQVKPEHVSATVMELSALGEMIDALDRGDTQKRS